ncbi:signal peptidase I [Cohnella sp. AR92]|uniref:signal peptidase I n=1 Tax=Cohnella sp. AR92 TaxID=648716 RepID=UPI000F8CB81B|nr:signal peptidase I [Cohnella sp. AR92]RUS46064.1 signal peptidase I [Cohnella sp. AR92]
MNIRMFVIFFFLISMILISGCTDTLNDTTTDKKIMVIPTPNPSLSKVKVQTDGMLAELGYEGNHPFGLGREVLVDMSYYEKHNVSRGDIVLFKIKKTTEYQDTDIARVVGLPGETVQLKKGQVYIDGKKLVAFYGDDPTSKENYLMKKTLTLNENEYVILADVRWRGFNDSQSEGAFTKEEILGKVVGYEENETTHS